jgi:HSP20 family protein
MDKKTKRDRRPHDFWGDFFNESFTEFSEMRRNMDKIFRDAMKSVNDDDFKKKPFVYGFSFRLGPDGIPHFEPFGNTTFGKPFTTDKTTETSREPLTDIIEAEDHITITMELPGVEKKDIDLEAQEDNLIINVDTATRKYHKELKLPEKLDLDSINPTYKNGVLDIVIKRKAEKPKKGKKISIN